jgi:ABC-2 type transport system permease protein
MNVVYILWLRQLKRHWRSKARMVGSLGQPLLFLLALGFGFGPVYARAGAGNYFQFLAPGVIAMSILFTAVFTGIEVIWDRQFGFLKETLVAPVPRTLIMLGKTLGGATVATFQGVIVFVIAVLFGFRPTSLAALPLALGFMFMVALTFTALGIAIASRLEDMQAFPLIMNFLVMPLFFLSGSLFPVDGLPPAIHDVVSVNPLSYGVDGLRGALLGATHFGFGADFAALASGAVLLVALGAWLFTTVQI